MCGIAALFGPDIDSRALARMLQVAARRGPEGTTARGVENGALGHTALRFVDPQHNIQPLILPDGSCLVWNGEIYNWRELRRVYALPARNDTQTLLLGLRQRGSAFVREIDGQFAFVAQLRAADGQLRTWLGRDKWGICPLVFGPTPQGALAVGSTTEIVQAAGARQIKSLPAGTWAELHGTRIDVHTWYQLPRLPVQAQGATDPTAVRQYAERAVRVRLPDQPNQLFTTLGGMDSQFVTACVARQLRGGFGGAVTVVPFDPDRPDDRTGGDYPYAKATLGLLEREGIDVVHHVVQLTPQHAADNLDRLLKLLGPDLFHILCGLAEDLVAATVRKFGGRVIMTAGGPDEAGRSYDRWTFLHRGLDQELAWRRLAEQFGSSEGVRAGLVFGEHGLENRVPLADLIELAAQIRPEHKQRVLDEGDGVHVASMRMEGKIFWRAAVRGLLPDASLHAPKQPIHGSAGALAALVQVLRSDADFTQARARFALRAFDLGWNGIVFADLRALDPQNLVTEGQLYTLYRWSKLEPELFACGGEHRYGPYVNYVPRCEDSPALRVHKPLCYDWQLGRDVPLRAVL